MSFIAAVISEKGLAIFLLIGKALIVLISFNSSTDGGISGVFITDHKMVTKDKKAPIKKE